MAGRSKDGGRPIEMRVNLKAPRGKHVMCLRSPGANGKFSGDSYSVGTFPPDDVDQDIVWRDGWFARSPKKAPQNQGPADSTDATNLGDSEEPPSGM